MSFIAISTRAMPGQLGAGPSYYFGRVACARPFSLRHASLIPLLQSERRRMVGLGRNHSDRQDRAGVGERNLKAADQHGKDERRFGQRELSAHTYARAGAEREIPQPRHRLSVAQKARWLEGVGI